MARALLERSCRPHSRCAGRSRLHVPGRGPGQDTGRSWASRCCGRVSRSACSRSGRERRPTLHREAGHPGHDLRRPGVPSPSRTSACSRSWRRKNRDLTEALEQQTATSEVLRGHQPLDVRPPARAGDPRPERGQTLRMPTEPPSIVRMGSSYRIAVTYGESPESIEVLRRHPRPPPIESPEPGGPSSSAASSTSTTRMADAEYRWGRKTAARSGQSWPSPCCAKPRSSA